MKPHQQILENIFDVLAHNTHYVESNYIVENYDIMVDFDNDEIEISDIDTGEMVCKLKIEYFNKQEV